MGVPRNRGVRLPKDFSGPVALFPLPNVVLFPGAILPLHVFEPRYRELVKDALGGQRLVAMALLKRGWEADYYGKPPIFPFACVGRIVQCTELADGRYNISLYGLERVELREMPSSTPYRQARVQILPTAGLEEVAPEADRWRAELWRALDEYLATIHQEAPEIPDVQKAAVPIDSLIDILAFSLPIDPMEKQLVLEKLSVRERYHQFMEVLQWEIRSASTKEKSEGEEPPESMC